MGRLANKNILITGGNSGIGRAAAQEFDREGARVAICGLNEGSLWAAKETLGAGSRAVRADVSNLRDLDTMFATIKREFGHLDGVFVNAGYSEFLLFEEVTEQSFDKVIAVNFKGGLLHDSKSLAATQARLVRNHQCVRWRAQGVADHLDRLDLQGRGRPSRSNPQRRTRGPQDSREYPEPRPDGHGDVRSLPRRRAGRGGQGRPPNQQSKQADG
jgi:NAD(P)-dependent dehydrogenase (short-subunit alcohol dehydrogenase family)